MRVAYERFADPHDLLRRAAELSARTIILDVEPLVASWASGQDALDRGVALVLSQVAADPGVLVVCFSTNSARRPSAVPGTGASDQSGPRVVYLASAGKPLRIAPYQDFPRPGVVIGDQVATDGLLARRLGYTFLHYSPDLAHAPAGPRLMRDLGRPLRSLLFPRHGPPPSEAGLPR